LFLTIAVRPDGLSKFAAADHLFTAVNAALLPGQNNGRHEFGTPAGPVVAANMAGASACFEGGSHARNQ
jgi:hypothetical protein